MRNKLSDLNNYLFAQLERLDDENVKGEELHEVIERGKAIADVAAQIISNRNLQLRALQVASGYCGADIKKHALLMLDFTENGEAKL